MHHKDGKLILFNSGLVKEIHWILLIVLIIDLIILSFSIYYAMKTIWLKKQEILDIVKSLKIVDKKDYLQSNEDLAVSIAGWQIRAKEIHDGKNYYLRKSMVCLMVALWLGIIIAIISTILKLILSF